MSPDVVHDVQHVLPQLPLSVEVFDTTLRDGSQVEGISLTVDDKLRIAEQLDLLGVHYIEGGWPGANPKDDEFFKRAATELHLERSTLVAFGSTRRPKGKVDEDPTLRQPRRGRHHRRCASSAKSWDYHVEQALLHHPRRGRGHGRRLRRVPGRPRPRRDARRRALLRRLQAQPRVRPAGAGVGRRQRRQPPRAVRHQRRLAAVRGGVDRRPTSCATSATTSSSASTATTTPAARWPTRWRPCGPAPATCRAASTAWASGRATATCPRSSRTSR